MHGTTKKVQGLLLNFYSSVVNAFNVRRHKSPPALAMRIALALAALSFLPIVTLSQHSSQTYPINPATPSALTPGTPLGSYALSDIENVNLSNGNLSISLPLHRIGGRGNAGYTISLPIENKWRVRDDYYPAGGGPGGPYGWAHHYRAVQGWWNRGAGYSAGIMRSRRSSTVTGRCDDPTPQSPTSGYVLTRLTFTSQNGSEIEFYDQQTGGTPAHYTGILGSQVCSNHPVAENRGSVWRASDGSGMTFISHSNLVERPTDTGDGVYPISGKLLFPDGTVYRFDGAGQISDITDRNGNKVSFNYFGAETVASRRLDSVTDSLNRVVSFTQESNQPHAINFKGFGGANRAIEVGVDSLSNVLQTGYTLKPTPELFPQLPESSSGLADLTGLVSYVRLPDGRQYNFKYNSHGDIARIELPTGGAFEYEWTGTAGAGCAAMIRRWVTERRVYPNGGTGTDYELKTAYNYAAGPTFDDPKITTVVEYARNAGVDVPLSHKKHYFNPDTSLSCSFTSSWNTGREGREYQTESYTPDGSTLFRRSTTDFEYGQTLALTGGGTRQTGYRPIRTTVTLADVSPNLIAKTEFGYDPAVSFNRQTDTWNYDYGDGQAGSLLGRSHTDFLTINPDNSNLNYLDNGIHLLNLPLQSWISSDAAGNDKLSFTKYEYDNYAADALHAALIARDDIIGHRRTSDTNSYNTDYTTRGNLTKVTRFTDAAAQTGDVAAVSQYDIAGNAVKVFDARGAAAATKYAAYTIDYSDRFGSPDEEARSNSTIADLNGKHTYAFATSAVNAVEFAGYTQFDYSTGALVNAEDANGVIVKRFYDDLLSRPTQSNVAVGTALERQTSIVYDDANRKVTTYNDLNTLGDEALKSESYYDKFGRATENRSYEADGSHTVTKSIPFLLVQDPVTQVLRAAAKSSNPYRPGSGETPVWTTALSDDFGRGYKTVAPDGSTIVATYSGNVKTVIDQAGKKRRGVSNALGQITRVIEDPDVSNFTTDYTFDATGNLRKTAQGVGTAEIQNRYFLYDSLGRVLRARQPEQGVNAALSLSSDALSDNNDQWSTGYAYDENGNIEESTNALNIKINGVYDKLNRLTLRDYTDATPDVAFTYEQPGIANSTGKLTVVSSSVSITKFTAFDATGGVSSSQQLTTAGQRNGTEQPYSFTYEYNLAGFLTDETYPSGRRITNNYQADGNLAAVSSRAAQAAPVRTFADSFSYTAAGAVEKMRLGNNRWETAQFNNRLQITQVGLGISATDTSLLKLEYDYGTATQNNGAMRQQKISFAGLAAPLVQTYTYDNLNRLQSATETFTQNGNANTQSWKQTFAYDRFGNRRFDETNGATTNLTHGCAASASNPHGVCNQAVDNPVIDPATNQFAAGQNYSYDLTGNLKADAAGKQFAYDAEGRQQSFGANGSNSNGGSYSYDGQGKRVRKVVGQTETVFVYDAFGKLAAEYGNAATATGTTTFLTADNLGSPRVATDRSGAVVSRHDYKTFGDEIHAGVGARAISDKYSLVDDIRQQFTSYERDSESGLDYAQARYYNSQHGRFTSVDPLTASASIKNPQTFNRYSYALNSPYKFTDPLGLNAQRPCTGNYHSARCVAQDVADENRTAARAAQQTQDRRLPAPEIVNQASLEPSGEPARGSRPATATITLTEMRFGNANPDRPNQLSVFAHLTVSVFDQNGQPFEGTVTEQVVSNGVGNPVINPETDSLVNGQFTDNASGRRAIFAEDHQVTNADRRAARKELESTPFTNGDTTATFTVRSPLGGPSLIITQRRDVSNADAKGQLNENAVQPGGLITRYRYEQKSLTISTAP